MAEQFGIFSAKSQMAIKREGGAGGTNPFEKMAGADYVDVAPRYAKGVVLGKIVACKWVKLGLQASPRRPEKKEFGSTFSTADMAMMYAIS